MVIELFLALAALPGLFITAGSGAVRNSGDIDLAGAALPILS